MTLEPSAAKLSGEALLLAMARQAGVAFPSLHILISDRCNHACEHCYQVHGEKGEITFDQLLAPCATFDSRGGWWSTSVGARQRCVPICSISCGMRTVWGSRPSSTRTVTR